MGFVLCVICGNMLIVGVIMVLGVVCMDVVGDSWFGFFELLLVWFDEVMCFV